jgi:hypothetical protein
VTDLQQAARDIESAAESASDVRFVVEAPDTDVPWHWYAGGFATAAAILIIGMIIYAIATNN